MLGLLLFVCAQALVVAGRWGILLCPRSRTLNFPLENQKSSLMLSNYKIVKLEVVRGHEMSPPPLPAGDCSGEMRGFINGNSTNYSANSFSSSSSAPEIHRTMFLCKRHEWIITFHSQIICKADLCQLFVSLSKLGNVNLSQHRGRIFSRKKYEYPDPNSWGELVSWHVTFSVRVAVRTAIRCENSGSAGAVSEIRGGRRGGAAFR